MVCHLRRVVPLLIGLALTGCVTSSFWRDAGLTQPEGPGHLSAEKQPPSTPGPGRDAERAVSRTAFAVERTIPEQGVTSNPPEQDTPATAHGESNPAVEEIKVPAKDEEDGNRPRVNLRGCIHTDAIFVNQSEKDKEIIGNVQNAVGFRSARLGAQGTVGEPDPAGGGVATPPSAAESSNPAQTRFSLSEGLVGETTDKAFRVHVGGRFDWDSGWYRVPQNLQDSLSSPLLDGTDIRRFRLGADGTVWEQVDFSLEADFSRASDFKEFESTPQTNIFITQAWIALRDLPLVDTVRAGHQKEYLTFSNATSSKFEPFMERPYIFDAFENDFSFDSGISINRTYFDQHLTSWVGAFWNGTRSQAFNVGGHYAVSGRATWLPVYNETEQRWVNLGLSGSLRAFQDNDPNTVTVRPLVRTGDSFDVPNLIDTGSILSRDGLRILGADIHSAWGPLTLGGEFLCWFIPNAFTGSLPEPNGTLLPGSMSVGNLFFSGFYVEALYFLTPGDHRPIDRVIPGFNRVRPVRNFRLARDGSGACCNGPGAWEVGVRYDHVDINSGLIQAGSLDSITFGVNWYLNPNARITANYVYTRLNTDSSSSSGAFDALGIRVHFDF